MRRRLLNVLGGFIGLCAGIGSPIAILLLLLAHYFGWWGATLEKYPWLVVALVLIFLSRFVLGALLDYHDRKYSACLHSPEGQRRRAQKVQESIAAIISDAQARPKLNLENIRCSVEGLPAGAVMTEARRLANN